MHEEEQSILSTLGIFKIKYSVLSELDIDKIDAFHIDLNTVFSTLYKLKNIFNDDNTYKITITSAILNLVAHFRAYFVKQKQKPNIYLYYSYFNDNKDTSDTESAIINALDLIEVIAKYIPSVYFIPVVDMRMDETMEYFIGLHDDNYILTKNLELYQFVSHKNSVKILRPARDDSYIVNRHNLYNVLSKDNDKEFKLSHELLSAVLSFSGVNMYKGAKGIGLKKAIKMIDKAVSTNRLVNSHYSDIENLLSDMEYDGNDNDIKNICHTFRMIDTSNCVFHVSSSLRKRLCDQFIVDKFSKKDLKALNVKYFTGFNSLMLHELLLEPKQSNNKTKIDW